MGLFDRSSSSTTNVDQTDASQVGQQDIDGPAVGRAGGNVNITQIDTDHGALADAAGLSRDALDFGRASIYAGQQGLEEVTSLARDVVDTGREQNRDTANTLRATTESALQFGDRVVGDVIESSRAGQSQTLDFAGDTIGTVVGSNERVLERVIADVQDRGRQFVGAINDTFARQSTNTDARLESITRYALIGGAVIAAAALVVPMFRSS